MTLLRRLNGGVSQSHRAPTSPTGQLPYKAWNNLHLSNCCLPIDVEKVIKEINDKIKSLPMFLCRPERDGVPMTYSGAGS
jgi:hypothetical protein